MTAEGKKKASKRYGLTHRELAASIGCGFNYVAKLRNHDGLTDDEIRAKWGMDQSDPKYLNALKTAKMAGNLPREIYELAAKAGVKVKSITEAKLNKGMTMAQVKDKYKAKLEAKESTHLKTPAKAGKINAHTIAAKTGMQLKHVNMLRLKGHTDADIMTHGMSLFDTTKANRAAARKAAKENPAMPPASMGPETGKRQQPSQSEGDIKDLYDATYRKESATARIKEFELYTKLQDVVPVAEEAIVWATVARVTRDSLMMIIDRVAGTLAAMESEEDVKIYLRDHFETALKNIPNQINQAYLEMIEKTEGEQFGATA